MKVLIVEDEIFSASSLQLMVEKAGFEVVDIVDNAEDAMQSYREHKPQIVLLDIMLKGNISGCELALQLHFENKNLILIFLTAYSDKEMIDYAINAKAYAYLLKPYRENEITTTLQLAKQHFQKQEKDQIKDKKESNHNNIVELPDGYSFNMKEKSLMFKGKKVHTSQQMEELFYYLCKHPNKYIPSKTLTTYIWGAGKNSDNLRSLVYRIKKTLSPNLITSEKYKGYKILLK